MFRGLQRVDATWLALIGLAIATVLLAQLLPGGATANAVLLTFAAIKGRRVVLDYLDLRAAPPIWRGLVTTWLLSVLAFAWVASAIALVI